MVLVKVEPMIGSTSRSFPHENVRSVEMFRLEDLDSNYYQVMRKVDRPGWCRTVWGIVIIVLFIFTGLMVYQLFDDYFQYKSYVESSIIWARMLPLPGITICNTNPLNYTKLKETLRKENDLEMLQVFDSLMDEFVRSNRKRDGDLEMDLVNFDDFKRWENEKGSLALRFQTHLSDMLIGEYKFVLGGVGEDINPVMWYSHSQTTDLGVCLELNNDGTFHQSSSGVEAGFEIDLDANVEHYLFSTKSKGFVIFIRDQGETVMLNRGGYVVSPGSETFLKLAVNFHSRLGKPHGTCQNVPSQFARYNGRYESVRECMQRQKMEAAIDLC